MTSSGTKKVGWGRKNRYFFQKKYFFFEKKKELLPLLHELLDEFLVVDLAVGILGSLEDDFDFLDGQFLTKSGQNVTDFGAHDGSISLLVEHAETFNEILVGTFLLDLGGLFNVSEELIKVAGAGDHFFLLWVSQNFGNILVGWLEAKTTDQVADLVKKMLDTNTLSGSTRKNGTFKALDTFTKFELLAICSLLLSHAIKLDF